MSSYNPEFAAALKEKKLRIVARRCFKAYVKYTKPKNVASYFSDTVCSALNKFLEDVEAGLRPIIVFQAPPQHGKSELVSRLFPAFVMGKYPDFNLKAASYNSGLASDMAKAVRQNREEPEYLNLFTGEQKKKKYSINTTTVFDNQSGKGSYLGDGIGGGFTGRPADIFIIDDPIKNHEEALSETTKKSQWNWFQTCCITRMSEHSGIIVMATSWSEDDLPARVVDAYRNTGRLTILRFPAINEEGEPGFNHELPLGPLVPNLHSIDQLKEIKAGFSDYWWSCIYQQSPMALGGNVFKQEFAQFYLPKDLPVKFEKVIASWDCTFKDTDGTDFVVGQVWGKKGADTYLLDQVRERMSFTKTCEQVLALKNKWPQIREILIEDKANGPAVIDALKKIVPGIIAVEPDGSKLARAHAITYVWEARNVYLPHEDIAPWVKVYTGEIYAFPAAANDDQVDAKTQALRYLYPLRGKLNISQAALNVFGAR